MCAHRGCEWLDTGSLDCDALAAAANVSRASDDTRGVIRVNDDGHPLAFGPFPGLSARITHFEAGVCFRSPLAFELNGSLHALGFYTAKL